MMQDNDDPVPDDPPRRRRAANFPRKLYQLLEDAHAENNEDIVCWMPDGVSFKVINRDRFVGEIMPRYFGSSNYRSYQKNLTLWNFVTVSLSVSSPHRGESRHELFVRGNPESIARMKRNNTTAARAAVQRIRRADTENTYNVQFPHPVSAPTSNSDTSSISDDTRNQNPAEMEQLARMIVSLLQQAPCNNAAPGGLSQVTQEIANLPCASPLLQSIMSVTGTQQTQRPRDGSVTATGASNNSCRNHVLQLPTIGQSEPVQGDIGATEEAEVLLRQLFNSLPAPNQGSSQPAFPIPSPGTFSSHRLTEPAISSTFATALPRQRFERQNGKQDEGKIPAAPNTTTVSLAHMLGGTTTVSLAHMLGGSDLPVPVSAEEETRRQREVLVRQIVDNASASSAPYEGASLRRTQQASSPNDTVTLLSLLGVGHHEQREGHPPPVASTTTQPMSSLPSTTNQRLDMNDPAVQVAILSLIGSSQQQQQQQQHQGHSSLAATLPAQQVSSLVSTPQEGSDAAAQSAILSLLGSSHQQQQQEEGHSSLVATTPAQHAPCLPYTPQHSAAILSMLVGTGQEQGHPSLVPATRTTTEAPALPSTQGQHRHDETAVQAAILSLLNPDQQQQLLLRLQQER